MPIPWRLSAAVLGGLSLLATLATFVAFDGPHRPRDAAAQTPPSSLAWTECYSSFQCATLSVPLDYERPQDRHIELALVRAPARKPEERIGVLLSNPGGPGASGNDFMRPWSHVIDDSLRDRFDIIGFDPRGVGDSTPLHCHDNIQEMLAADPEPETADEWAEVRAVTQRFVDLCVERGGELLAHLGSLDVVRDMDRIREALGEDQVSYVGYSYGTVLGALYADEFPDRVRAIVLDGPVDLASQSDEMNITQALGFERALDHFLEDCREQGCELARGGRDPGAAIDALFAKAREAPIPSSGADRSAGPGEALTGVLSALYRQAFWPSLARAVQTGLDGDGTWLVQMTDGLWGRRGEEYDNSFEMNAAVNCLDYSYPRDVAHYQELASRAALRAPRFGAALAVSGLTCGQWPVPAAPIGTPDAESAPPLLVIGTTGDPATPYEWALAMRRDLDPAVLVTNEGEGHTAYASGNRCIDRIVNAYLLTLTVPADGTTCAGAGDPRPPSTPVAASLPTRPPASMQGTPPAATSAVESGDATAVPAGQLVEVDPDAGRPWLWIAIGSGAVAGIVAAIATVRLRASRR